MAEAAQRVGIGKSAGGSLQSCGQSNKTLALVPD
jgi:hypothetical protein